MHGQSITPGQKASSRQRSTTFPDEIRISRIPVSLFFLKDERYHFAPVSQINSSNESKLLLIEREEKN